MYSYCNGDTVFAFITTCTVFLGFTRLKLCVVLEAAANHFTALIRNDCLLISQVYIHNIITLTHNLLCTSHPTIILVQTLASCSNSPHTYTERNKPAKSHYINSEDKCLVIALQEREAVAMVMWWRSISMGVIAMPSQHCMGPMNIDSTMKSPYSLLKNEHLQLHL